MARLLMALVKLYRLLFSPWVGQNCRFEPTCSLYALQALQQHGAAAGTYLALKRIVRCNPWCEGGCDPVPGISPFAGLIHAAERPDTASISSEKNS